jgi:hypothetical protein
MADVTIKVRGEEREIAFDLEAVTIGEYVEFAQGGLPAQGDFAFIAKVSGLDEGEVKQLTQPQYRRLVRAYFKVATASDPN